VRFAILTVIMVSFDGLTRHDEALVSFGDWVVDIKKGGRLWNFRN
jgi:hypothetical protein